MEEVNRIHIFHWSLLVFVIYGIIYSLGFTADIRGIGDASKAIKSFASSEYFSFFDLSLKHELQSRLVILFLSTIELLVLVYLKAIKLNVAILYGFWPFSAFLATKIKYEFFVFPLAMIRTDYSKKVEYIILGLLIMLGVATGENNVFVVVLYRLTVLIYRSMSIKKVKILFFLTTVGALIADFMFSRLANIFPLIARFEWTRDFVNPEYSIIETVAVFFATFFIGVHPQSDYMITLLFAFLITSYIATYKRKELKLLFQDRRFYALIIVIVVFSSITHAFQSARYYYFFLPILSTYFFRNEKDYSVILILGAGISLVLLSYHNWENWVGL